MPGEIHVGGSRPFPVKLIGDLFDVAADQGLDDPKQARIETVFGEDGVLVRWPFDQADDAAKCGVLRQLDEIVAIAERCFELQRFFVDAVEGACQLATSPLLKTPRATVYP